jgi:hypothetical protein
LRPATLAALGIAAYLVFLAALAPASVVAARLLQGGPMELSDVHGTIWKGAASARIRLAAGALDLKELRWRFAPMRLLTGRIAFDVTALDPRFSAQGQLARSFGGNEARDVGGKGDAAMLAAVLPLLATWQPRGELAFTAPLLAWDEREVRGSARAEWRGAAISLPEARALGTYVAELRGEGGPAKLTLTTPEGTLRLSGEGSFAPPGQLALRGEARAEGAGAEALEPLLNLLGPRRADGARAFSWRLP